MPDPHSLHISLDATLLDQVTLQAHQEGLTPEQWAEQALRQALPATAQPFALIRQGELYWGAPEAGGIAHPLLVVQPDYLNRSRLATVVVCALTTNLGRGAQPGNVLLEAGLANLPRASVVEVDKVSAVQKDRLGARIGCLPAEALAQVLAGLRFVQRLTEARFTSPD